MLVLAVLSWAVLAKGQDTLSLRIFEVEEYIAVPKSYTVEAIDSNLGGSGNGQLSTVLEKQTLVNLKNYGPSQIASASFRGSDPNHTQVYWNGINLNSPALGMSDMNLVSTTALDKIEVGYGVAGNMLGNGAIGGAVHLYSGAGFNTTYFNTGLYADGIHSKSISLDANLGGGKSAVAFGFSHFSTANSFTYWDVSERPYEVELMEHAHRVSTNLVLGGRKKIGKRGILSFDASALLSRRNIPRPINSNVPPTETQQDSMATVALNYSRETERWKTVIIAGVNRAANVYNDSLLGVFGRNTYSSFQTRLINGWMLRKNIRLSTVVSYQHDLAESRNFSGRPEVRSLYLFADVQWRITRRFFLNAGNRAQLTKYQKPVALLPGVGVAYKVVPGLEAFFNGAKTVRFPTLNELFWQPGGNTDLKPESALTAEVGFFGSAWKEAFSWRVNVYRNDVTNWVRWLPTAGAIFSPRNIDHVIAKGVEARFAGKQKVGTVTAELFLNGSRNLSQRVTASDNKQWPQLIYVPKFQANTGVDLTWRNWRLEYRQQLLGKRYVSFDNQVFMPAFTLGSATLTYQTVLKKHRLTCSTTLHNGWNTQYQVVAWRPMPGRYISFCVEYHFQK